MRLLRMSNKMSIHCIKEIIMAEQIRADEGQKTLLSELGGRYFENIRVYLSSNATKKRQWSDVGDKCTALTLSALWSYS